MSHIPFVNYNQAGSRAGQMFILILVFHETDCGLGARRFAEVVHKDSVR